jgi:hydroxyethylthiazole kinase-like uncharacterized protein yjeF
MDNAGNCLARAALDMKPKDRVDIFCGKGNNGGDGYVCAAELLRRKKAVTVWGIGASVLTEGSLAKNAADACLAAGGAILPVSSELKAEDIKCDLIVDALLGTGLTRQVSGLYAHVIALINAVFAPVLACDLPSGVDADTGEIMGTAVKASKTMMMGLAKPACALPPGAQCFGQLEVCDIGLPSALSARFEQVGETKLVYRKGDQLERQSFAGGVPPPLRRQHRAVDPNGVLCSFRGYRGAALRGIFHRRREDRKTGRPLKGKSLSPLPGLRVYLVAAFKEATRAGAEWRAGLKRS